MLRDHAVEPIDAALDRELTRSVAAAQRELAG